MATILDLGLLQSFDVIFPVILIFALVFAILQKTKIVGDSLGINSIIAVSIAFMALLSDNVIQVVKFIVPWFTIAIIFFLLIILVFQVFGAKESDIASYIKGDKTIGWVIIGVGIVIIFAAFANVLGQQLTEASLQSAGSQSSGSINGTIATTSEGVATGNFQQNIYSTLFHPKVLGLLVLFGIAIFAVALLTGPAI